jgi:hypothetical protein
METYEFLDALTIRWFRAQVPLWGERRAEAELARMNERARWEKVGAERAGKLLRECLSADQYASYQANGWFEVTGSLGGRWRISNDGMSGNVTLLGKQSITYCGYPRPGGEWELPQADVMLAQALHLITDEGHFRRTAIHGWTTGSCGFEGCPMCRMRQLQ